MEIRYPGSSFDLRSSLLRLNAKLQGKNVLILKDNIPLCAQVLQSSVTKGSFIEQFVATPAWDPILSIESTDHGDWKTLIKHFRPLFAKMDWEKRTREILAKVFAQNFDVITAKEISLISLSFFFELVFKREPNDEEKELYYQASLEWRKEIAMKGIGDKKIKYRFFKHLTKLTEESFGQTNPYFVSAIAQPFIISPQINFADIMAGVAEIFNQAPEVEKKARATDDINFLRGVVYESMRLYHPFPVLERELTKDLLYGGKRYKKGDQVFIMLDEFIQDQAIDPDSWVKGENPFAPLLFGVGPRSCPGRQLADKLLPHFLKFFLAQKSFRPMDNLVYSGRINDSSSSAKETIYQLSKMAQFLGKSIHEAAQ